MSKPSFENISQWFFEYTEGNLSVAQEIQFLDFLKENPTLIDELKAWKLAKATPTTSTMPIAGLLKPAPLYMRPPAIAAYSILLIAFAWFIFPTEDTSPLYSEASVDTEIIKLAKATSIQDIAPVSNKIENDFASSTQSTVPHSITNSNTAFEIEELEYTEEETDYTNTKEDNFPNLTLSNSSSTNNTVLEDTDSADQYSRSLSKDSPSTFLRKAEHLDNVIAFLNSGKSSSDIAIAAVETTETAEVTAKEVVTSTKSTKSSFSSALRKIKRMIDQPTALQNTREPYFHAPMMTGFRANPGMAGRSAGNRIQLTSRMQWAGTDSRQLMNTASWDGYIYALRGGIGLDLNYNTYGKGALNNYAVGISYSPKFSITKNISFEPVIRFKMGVMDLQNPSSLLGSQFELNRNNVTPFFENDNDVTGGSLWYRDIGLGFMLNTNTFYVGFNADNLGRHDNNYYSNDLTKTYRENIYYTAVIGTEYQSLTKDISFDGYGLFQSYGDLTELWVGGNFRYKWLQVGAGVNTKADFGASVGFNLNRVTIHYNIDYTKSKLFDRKYLSHQVTMKILLKPNRSTTKFYNF